MRIARTAATVLLVLLILAVPAFAAAPDAAPAEAPAAMPEVQLEWLQLTEKKDSIDYLTQTDFERKTANSLWDGLRGVNGVNIGDSGGRGETVIQIRGSTRYQVGMYIDDVPVATAYRNEWDASNTMLFDVESIEVSKGFSSPLLASNNGLAGTINLRTRKPQKELKFTARYLNFFDRNVNDQGRMFGLSLGSRQDLFYLKASVMQDKRDFYTLSSDFDRGRWENGGRRENSDYKNRSLNLMAGLTPTEDIDVMFGYTVQRFEKGQPINASRDAPNLGVGGNQTRLWRWPTYDTDRYYLNADFGINDQTHLKLIAYYDKHKDRSENYTDLDFSNHDVDNDQLYDQYTTGAQVKFDCSFNDSHKLAASAGYRMLSHEGYRWSGGKKYQEADIKENYWDFGAEYTWRPVEPLTILLGTSYTYVDPHKYSMRNATGAEYKLSDKNDLDAHLFNYQVGAFWDVTREHQIFATFAKKGRVGTMRERFQRNGNVAANPDLDPEEAFHYELGYRGLPLDSLKVNASVFYSRTKDKITSTRDAGGNTYYVNTDKAEVWGLEAGVELMLNRHLSAGATFSWTDWDTEYSTPQERNLTYVPSTCGTVYMVVSPLEKLSIIPELYMTSSFYNNADHRSGASNTRSPGFATLNLKATFDLTENFMIEAGAKNILDKDYYYTYGYNQAGVTYFAGLTVTF